MGITLKEHFELAGMHGESINSVLIKKHYQMVIRGLNTIVTCPRRHDELLTDRVQTLYKKIMGSSMTTRCGNDTVDTLVMCLFVYRSELQSTVLFFGETTWNVSCARTERECLKFAGFAKEAGDILASGVINKVIQGMLYIKNDFDKEKTREHVRVFGVLVKRHYRQMRIEQQHNDAKIKKREKMAQRESTLTAQRAVNAVQREREEQATAEAKQATLAAEAEALRNRTTERLEREWSERKTLDLKSPRIMHRVNDEILKKHRELCTCTRCSEGKPCKKQACKKIFETVLKSCSHLKTLVRKRSGSC